jgi:hypothetical protein
MSGSTYVAYEIPLSPSPQKFNINIFGTQYILQFIYRDVSVGSNAQSNTSTTFIFNQDTINTVEQYLGSLAVFTSGDVIVEPNGELTIYPAEAAVENTFNGWCMDIFTSAGVPILSSIPLTTGADLLAQYAYLGLGFALFVATDDQPLKRPTYDNLGSTSHLYLVANPL